MRMIPKIFAAPRYIKETIGSAAYASSSLLVAAWEMTQKLFARALMEHCPQGTVAAICTGQQRGKQHEGDAAKPAILFWRLRDPYQPERILLSPACLLTFALHPTDQSQVIGGCSNGVIVVWQIDVSQVKLTQI